MRLLRTYGVELALVVALALAVAFFGYLAVGLLPSNVVDESFDGARALNSIERQVDFGARTPGTQSSLAMSDWLVQQLIGLGWDVVVQEFAVNELITGRNIVAMRSPQSPPAGVSMLATHYDSRLAADADPDEGSRALPAPGANHGASGAAVLLELARTLDVDVSGNTICLAFLDAEANDGIAGWPPFAGSRQLAGSLSRDVLRCASPRVVVAIDQVGAPDARFYPDADATPWVNTALWQTAAEAGFGAWFVVETDPDSESAAGAEPLVASHSAFVEAGYAGAVVIDRAAPFVRTLADTPASLSAETLGAVGRTLELWLETGAEQPADAAPSPAP